MLDNESPDVLHVLLVEDNDDDVEIVRRVLSQVGLPVHLHVARDGLEALDFLYRRGSYADAPQPALILLDLRLPIVHGLDVLQQVKADPDLSRIGVYVLTGSRSEEDLKRSMDLGADGFLPKAFAVEDVKYILIGTGAGRSPGRQVA
jgi:CheY-like chemotaxis protein